MHNIFVIDVLKTLQHDEQEEFRYFLQSPYFNRGPNQIQLVSLLGILQESIKQEEIDELEKNQIFQRLFPEKAIVESKVDKLMSELKRLMQQFLVTARYNLPENEYRKQLDLVTDLRHKGLETRYYQALDKLKKDLDAQPWETVDMYFLRHLMAQEEHEWLSVLNKAKGDVNVPDTIRRLDKYFWVLRTEMLNRLLNQQGVTILTPEAVQIIEEPWEVPERHLNNDALIKIIWKIHQLLKNENPEIEDFLGLFEQLKQFGHKFSPEKLGEFFTYLRNICITLINAGKAELNVVLHEIQRDNLERDYFYIDGKILPNAFLSITQTAINVNSIGWAKTFIEQHKYRVIDENETQDFFRTNMALCLFAEKKYDEALDIIPLGSSYSFYHLLARRLELKIYYEQDSELLPYKIDAFKMFISRAGSKVLSETLHELHVNFVNFLRQLSLSPKIRDKTRSAQMTKRIQEKQLVGERAWLLEKARELGERSK